MKVDIDSGPHELTVSELVPGKPYRNADPIAVRTCIPTIYVAGYAGHSGRHLFIFRDTEEDKMPQVKLLSDYEDFRFLPAGKVKITIDLGP